VKYELLAGLLCILYVLYHTQISQQFTDVPQSFIYYQWSPVLATMMTEDEQIKEEVRLLVNGVLELLQ